MFLHMLLFCVTATLIASVSSQWETIIKLPQGDVKGSAEQRSGGKYTAFRGIPYAKPPIGNLRLRDPEEPDVSSTIIDATNFRSKCPQWDLLQKKLVGEEDCLFINVYTPLSEDNGSSSTKVFPVMVFIHGGNFEKGSADSYDPERFMESRVVLVTFNYRLGILGFLSTGDGSCPGNLGLKDQVLALKWVRDNIQNFGGNTSSITLFGQDVGATSVFLHILSPKSQGLFHHAITQSGSPLCDWTLEENPRSFAVDVAKRLRCSTSSNSAIVDCIRQKPLTEILGAQMEEKTFGDYPLRAIPVVEKDGFLPDTPAGLLSSGNFKPIPLMSGINKDDGATFYPVINLNQEKLKKNSTFLLNHLIPTFLLTVSDVRDNIETVSEALFFHYFHDVDTTNVSQVLQPFINMTTDAMFVSCNYRTLQKYSAMGARVYMYVFEYKGKFSMLDIEQGTELGYKGVSHGDELLYLFKFKSALDVDNMKKEQLHYLWSTFARTGESPIDVNPEYPKWEPYTVDLKHYYLLGRMLQLRESYRQTAVDLWMNHLPALSRIRCNDDRIGIPYQTGGFGWIMLAIAIILLIVAGVLAVMLLRKSKSQYFTTKSDDK